MKRPSILTDFSLLKHNANFRHVFVARTLSLLTIGMLVVAIPKQVYDLTQDSLSVAIAMACEGVAMFIGLLLGGVLSDQKDRKKIILFARSVCGLGFFTLMLNALLEHASLWAIYVLSAWDGFFGALGVTAMMAIMPNIVGRENIVQARAISMVSVRLATVIAPALGGILIAWLNVAWVYAIASLGTLLTVITLLKLPPLLPKVLAEKKHPVQQLLQGFQFVLNNKVVGCTVLIGTLLSFSSAIRILFPQMVEQQFSGGALQLGLLYSAVPLGATLGALLSGWTTPLKRPGWILLLSCVAIFSCMILFGLSPWFWLSCGLLVVFGYLMAIANLLQYSIVQGHTPDQYAGRINAIWLAQDASGDSIATTLMGTLTRFLPISTSIACFGTFSLALIIGCLLRFKSIRQTSFQDPALQEAEMNADKA